MTAYSQFPSCANNGRPAANPTPFANSDFAALCNTLSGNWSRDIFVRMIMILYEDMLSDEHTSFQMD
jgi:hypothetical protein